MLVLFLIGFLFAANGADSHGGNDSAAAECVCKDQEKFPTPKRNENTLFYIQRTPNTNTIVYDLNTDTNGVLDDENPIHAYWIRYSEKGQKEELSFIQRRYAYGIQSKKVSEDEFDVRFVSYKDLPFKLVRKAAGAPFEVIANVEGTNIVISKLFLQIEGGSFWLPNVVCVEVKGKDPETKQEIVKRFKP